MGVSRASRMGLWLQLLLSALVFAMPAWAEVFIPRYSDPKVRVERPDLSSLRVIRFMTDDEYPPLHFADPEGGLVGFSVDLARAVCEKLTIACTIQARRFDTLLDSLKEGRGDVVAAAIPITPDLQQGFAAGAVYHRTPARFVAGEALAREPADAAHLAGRRIAAVDGSAHAAFLASFFPRSERRLTADLPTALSLLRLKQVDYVFADAQALAIWLGGRGGAGHAFAGGAWTDNRYFGEGIGFITRKEDQLIRRALDYGLQQLWDDGTYAKLYLRYFPISLY